MKYIYNILMLSCLLMVASVSCVKIDFSEDNESPNPNPNPTPPVENVRTLQVSWLKHTNVAVPASFTLVFPLLDIEITAITADGDVSLEDIPDGNHYFYIYNKVTDVNPKDYTSPSLTQSIIQDNENNKLNSLNDYLFFHAGMITLNDNNKNPKIKVSQQSGDIYFEAVVKSNTEQQIKSVSIQLYGMADMLTGTFATFEVEESGKDMYFESDMSLQNGTYKSKVRTLGTGGTQEKQYATLSVELEDGTKTSQKVYVDELLKDFNSNKQQSITIQLTFDISTGIVTPGIEIENWE